MKKKLSFSERLRSEVLSSIDLVDVIRAVLYVSELDEVVGSGIFLGNCPFCPDEKDSFVVHAVRQTWHCFSCGCGGNAIDFVMNYDGLSYVKALQALSDYAASGNCFEFRGEYRTSK